MKKNESKKKESIRIDEEDAEEISLKHNYFQRMYSTNHNKISNPLDRLIKPSPSRKIVLSNLFDNSNQTNISK